MGTLGLGEREVIIFYNILRLSIRISFLKHPSLGTDIFNMHLALKSFNLAISLLGIHLIEMLEQVLGSLSSG